MGALSAISTFAANGAGFPTAEDGTYTCSLVEIQPTEKRKYQSEDMEPALKFVFETVDEMDKDGKPYRFVKWTGTSYGSEKANLTILINGMVGRSLTLGEYEETDIEDLTAKKYRVTVTETESKTEAGRFFNNIVTVKPVKSGSRQSASSAAGSSSRPAPKNMDTEGDFPEPF